MGGLIDHYHAETLQRIRRDERHLEIAVTVPSTRLETLLRAHGLKKVDYLSIDVEGAERPALRSLDFDEFDITALSIENNRPGRESYEDIMDPAGYRQVAVLGVDEIWVRRSVLSQDPRGLKKLIGGPGFNHLVEARHGYVLYNVNDRYIGRSIEHYGEWSPGETALLGQFRRSGHYVVDVGAHIGTHTLAVALLVGERGRVFAFEPQRMVAQVLAANVALNSLANVHTYHLGLGAEDGALWLADIDYSREGNFGGVSLDAVARPEGDSRPKYRVAVVRLDDFYDQPRLDLIKIDVEGMEVDVLRGAGGLISGTSRSSMRRTTGPRNRPNSSGSSGATATGSSGTARRCTPRTTSRGVPGTSSIAGSCRSTCSASMHRRTVRSEGRRKSPTTPRIRWRRAQLVDRITTVGFGRGYGRWRSSWACSRSCLLLVTHFTSPELEARVPGPLQQAMAACRRAWVGVALFSACVNLLMLTVPMYMMQVYDRVLTTSNIDTLLALSAMVAVGLGTFGLLDAVRNRILARVATRCRPAASWPRPSSPRAAGPRWSSSSAPGASSSAPAPRTSGWPSCSSAPRPPRAARCCGGDSELALAATVQRLRERGVTIVLIAQRAGIMALADKVLVLKAGAVEAYGPRDEILRSLRRANLAPVKPGKVIEAVP